MRDSKAQIHPPVEHVIGSSPVVPLPEDYFVVRLEERPESGEWLAVVDDGIEVTAVGTRQALSEPPADAEGPFRALRLEIVTPFETPGFIAAAAAALAEKGINVLVFSSFSFDYVLVEAKQLESALAALAARGFPAAR